jgi:hypothetical protein
LTVGELKVGLAGAILQFALELTIARSILDFMISLEFVNPRVQGLAYPDYHVRQISSVPVLDSVWFSEPSSGS